MSSFLSPVRAYDEKDKDDQYRVRVETGRDERVKISYHGNFSGKEQQHINLDRRDQAATLAIAVIGKAECGIYSCIHHNFA
jgi:hypothetical protein